MLLPMHHIAVLVHVVSKGSILVFYLGSLQCQWVKPQCYSSKVSHTYL